MQYLKVILLLLTIYFLSACAAVQPYYADADTDPDHGQPAEEIDRRMIEKEVFLVGDLNIVDENSPGVHMLEAVYRQLDENNPDQAVVLLGNSVGPGGLPEEETDRYQALRQVFEEWIPKFRNKTEDFYFIPGNHEWTDGSGRSLEKRKNLEKLIQDIAGENIYEPNKGCGEPEVVELGENLILVLVDSPWLLQGDDSEERKRSGCEIDDELEFIIELEDILGDNKKKNVILATHHPVFTNGRTGGNYPASSHLLPLPVIGSLFTGAKTLFGSEQQFGHPHYDAYRAAIKESIQNFEGIVTVSAHEPNMEYRKDGDNHFVVAGSGSKKGFLHKGGDVDFAYMQRGFAKITHTRDMKVWLEFFRLSGEASEDPVPVYRKMIFQKEFAQDEEEIVVESPGDYPETVRVKASDKYKRKRNAFDKQYAVEWGTEVSVPVLWLDEMKGGLTPIKQGGGFATKSLRLENPEGKQYVLRSVDKDVSKVVPPALRGTFVKELLQQAGIGSAHPYAALVVPRLADAAKIYHATPKYFWLPNQEALGIYNREFGGRLYLFEERAGGEVEEVDSFGNPEDAVNTLDLVDEILKDHKHKLDQAYNVRARLLDVLIGDWDRHDDQWRWGVYEDPENDDHKIYRPIPRDRDQVFFRINGLIYFIPTRNWFNPQLRLFDEKIENLPGLIRNGRFFDRHFLNEMTLEDFRREAKNLQEWITDDVIDEAFKDWPEEIHAVRGEDIIRTLKIRRADLVSYAEEFYTYISKTIDIPGTVGKNLFEVTAQPGNKLGVRVYHLEKDEKHQIYQRTIDGKITKEVRLYGLDKSDTFQFSGNAGSTICIRVVGGSGGNDQIINESRRLKIIAYDRPEGMELEGRKVKSKLKDLDGINAYDRKDWAMDRHFHFPILSFYTDEGVGIGYQVWWKKHGFRKDPYKSNHALNIAYFAGNQAFLGKYTGHWPDAFGHRWDLRVLLDGKAPTFTQFFYGLGNMYENFEETFPEVENANRARFHIVRGTSFLIQPSIEHRLKRGRLFTIQPFYQFYDMNDMDDSDNEEVRFIFRDEAGRSQEDFESKNYMGLSVGFQTTRLNNEFVPTRGFRFKAEARYRQSLHSSAYSNMTLSSNLAMYIPFDATDKFVLAVNIGGAYTLGDYEFFHANYLANKSRLRGFRLWRFAGDGMVYTATDLRIRLFDGFGPFPTSLGIYGSFDMGRVFLEGEENNDLHASFGGGIFLQPMDVLGFKLGYHLGKEDRQLIFGGAMAF